MNGEKQEWQNGKCMVFDDTFSHTAVNNSDQTRVVLLLDFTPNGGNQTKIHDERDQSDYLDQITAKYGFEK